MSQISKPRLFVSSLLVALTVAPLASAEDTPPAPVVPTATVPAAQTEVPTWRRYAFPAAVAAAGVGLAAGIVWQLSSQGAAEDFNDLKTRSCSSLQPNRGGGDCAALYDKANSRSQLSRVSLGLAGAFAITAVVLKLTEPDAAPSPTTPVPARKDTFALECAPGLGWQASCRLTF